MERDEKGRFKKGVTPKGAKPINVDIAKEYQARSAASRRENTILRKTLLKSLLEDGGGGYSKLEHLVRKALENHRNGKLTFHDLKDLSSLLGEDTLNIKSDNPVIVVSQESIQAADKWAKKKDE